MIFAMPQKSGSKVFKLPTPEEKARHTRYVSGCLVAINQHENANESLARLATAGCDIAALWLILETYLRTQNTGVFQQKRRKAAETRVRLKAILRQLRSVLTKTISVEEQNHGSSFASILEDLSTDLNDGIASIEMLISGVGQMENPRGRLRPELLLVCAVMYLRARTGRPCYREIADILEVLQLSKGRSRVIDPENLRRAYERYGSLKSEEELALYERNFQRYVQNDLAHLLRGELLSASFARSKTHRTPARSKKIN
jgi:hypothetical protein